MPKSRKPPVVLTAAQKEQSLLSRAGNLRAIAASSRDPSARKVLLARAEEWERRAYAVRADAASPPTESSEPA